MARRFSAASSCSVSHSASGSSLVPRSSAVTDSFTGSTGDAVMPVSGPWDGVLPLSRPSRRIAVSSCSISAWRMRLSTRLEWRRPAMAEIMAASGSAAAVELRRCLLPVRGAAAAAFGGEWRLGASCVPCSLPSAQLLACPAAASHLAISSSASAHAFCMQGWGTAPASSAFCCGFTATNCVVMTEGCAAAASVAFFFARHSSTSKSASTLPLLYIKMQYAMYSKKSITASPSLTISSLATQARNDRPTM
mmetsp:Transcript_108333/g.316940  ORF Transcript_108333/g.316940 Transcript_108333/m.316940 type:complete len:250 (+) Transcript_108333:613-1362(+)